MQYLGSTKQKYAAIACRGAVAQTSTSFAGALRRFRTCQSGGHGLQAALADRVMTAEAHSQLTAALTCETQDFLGLEP